MIRRHLIIRLEAPLVSFGGVAIDNYGVTRDFPARSMLAGLLGNALGFERTDAGRLQRLQDRLVFAVRRERESYIGVLRDNQNAKLEANDKGWTTRGFVEGRGGGADTHKSPHRRFRDYHPDALAIVALRLEPAEETPTLDNLVAALESPQRPLFIGRKPCLPSQPLIMRKGPVFIDAAAARAALECVPLQTKETGARKLRAQWPENEAPESPEVLNVRGLCDERNWHSGLHGGSRRIVEGWIALPAKEAS
jgi:CRISPR system Cascade subunit CasD